MDRPLVVVLGQIFPRQTFKKKQKTKSIYKTSVFSLRHVLLLQMMLLYSENPNELQNTVHFIHGLDFASEHIPPLMLSMNLQQFYPLMDFYSASRAN